MDLSFTPGPEHARLATFVGTWEGPVRTWLDPSAPPDIGSWRVTGTPLLDGRFVRLTYQGVVMGKAHVGELTLAYERDDKRFAVAWIDTFHTGTMLMHSTGERGGEAVDVVGSFPAGDGPRWGWRTSVRRDGDALVVEMWIRKPDGAEGPAVEVVAHKA